MCLRVTYYVCYVYSLPAACVKTFAFFKLASLFEVSHNLVHYVDVLSSIERMKNLGKNNAKIGFWHYFLFIVDAFC